MQRRRSVMLFTVLVLLTAGCVAAERTFQQNFRVSPGSLVRVDTDAGSVIVSGSTGDEVSISAVIRGRDRDVERFTLTADQREGVVEVRGKGGRKGWSWTSSGLQVVITIRAPRTLNLNLHTSGGDVTVENIAGKVEGETSGGDVRLKDVEGPVIASTSGGDIRVERVRGMLRAETSGGDVQATQVTGDVTASTSGGDIRLAGVDGRVDARTSGGDVRVRLTGQNRGVHTETSGGDIDIVVDKTVAATIDAGTSGGEVTCDVPIMVSGKIAKSSLRGALNGGGPVIYAHTSGGDVRIRDRE